MTNILTNYMWKQIDANRVVIVCPDKNTNNDIIYQYPFVSVSLFWSRSKGLYLLITLRVINIFVNFFHSHQPSYLSVFSQKSKLCLTLIA